MRGFVFKGKVRDFVQAIKALAQLEREMPHLTGTLDGKVIRL